MARDRPAKPIFPKDPMQHIKTESLLTILATFRPASDSDRIDEVIGAGKSKSAGVMKGVSPFQKDSFSVDGVVPV